MIQLYASPLSGNAHKVRMALAFLDLSWDERPTDAAARREPRPRRRAAAADRRGGGASRAPRRDEARGAAEAVVAGDPHLPPPTV